MFSVSRKPESAPPPAPEKTKPAPLPSGEFYRTSVPTRAGSVLSSGVSIKGSVKCGHALVIDGEVEGTIDSSAALTIGTHARVRGEIRTKSAKIQGTIDGNIFVTERCELQSGCTLRGDIEAPRLVVNEEAIFLGNAKVSAQKQLVN
ncbi:MAG TPA: polymer-forming cytoskeletal protein [Chthoniobacterales bacterium]